MCRAAEYEVIRDIADAQMELDKVARRRDARLAQVWQVLYYAILHDIL